MRTIKPFLKLALLLTLSVQPVRSEAMLDAQFVEVNYSSYFRSSGEANVSHAYQVMRQGAQIGKIWTEILPESHSNCLRANLETEENHFGCKATHTLNHRDELLSVIIDGTEANLIIESEATRACKSIGGVLPTLSDFQDLVRSFQITPDPVGVPVFFKTHQEKENFWSRSFPLKEKLSESFATRNCSQSYGSSERAFPCESNLQFNFFSPTPAAEAQMRANTQNVLCVSKSIE